ncbi:MAG: TlpA family protein disulfide reductase [Candidatus Limnocylindria bacterium]
MKAQLPVIAGIAMLVAACSAPSSGEQGAGATDGTAAPGAPSPPAASEPVGSTKASRSDTPADSDPLLAFELVDVRSGKPLTLGELAAEKPVLVEAMAIWCTTCLAQQREVVDAHQAADFHSVGIDCVGAA